MNRAGVYQQLEGSLWVRTSAPALGKPLLLQAMGTASFFFFFSFLLPPSFSLPLYLSSFPLSMLLPTLCNAYWFLSRSWRVPGCFPNLSGLLFLSQSSPIDTHRCPYCSKSISYCELRPMPIECIVQMCFESENETRFPDLSTSAFFSLP